MFIVENLSPAMTVWYERYQDALNEIYGTEINNIDFIAASGDLYLIARIVGAYCQSLRIAYRLIGDPSFLAEAVRVMEIARGSLDDYDGDSYLEWVHDYGLGLSDNSMDRGLIWMQTAMFVYWLSFHIADYPVEYATWSSILEDQFVPQGYRHENLMHMDSHHLRWMYVRNQMGYATDHDLRPWIESNFMPSMLTDDNGAFVWDHRRVLPGPVSPDYAQPSGYSQETLASILELYMCNVSPFCSDVYMAKWAKTAAHNILITNECGMSNDVTGNLGFQWINPSNWEIPADTKYPLMTMPAYAAWDTSGRIDLCNEWAYNHVNGGKRSVLFACYGLVAEGIKYVNANGGSTPWKL